MTVPGEKRGSLTGIGRSHDSEAWFRLYGSETFVDLTLVSTKAGHMYIVISLRCYHERGAENFERFRKAYKRMFGWSKSAFDELLEVGLVHLSDDGELTSKMYSPGNQGVATIRPPIPDYIRNEVLERDGRACVYCGASEDLAMDHVIPISKEGADTANNLVTACRPCNSRKGNRFDG